MDTYERDVHSVCDELSLERDLDSRVAGYQHGIYDKGWILVAHLDGEMSIHVVRRANQNGVAALSKDRRNGSAR